MPKFTSEQHATTHAAKSEQNYLILVKACDKDRTDNKGWTCYMVVAWRRLAACWCGEALGAGWVARLPQGRRRAEKAQAQRKAHVTWANASGEQKLEMG
jgi:hypothetical protein